MPISLTRDGDRVQATFDYSNATQNTSKKPGGGLYYTFAINGGDKLHVNRHAFMAIDAAWCGKEGTMKIERVGVDSYYCDVLSKGADYPLELKQWNTSTNSYDDVQGWQMGQDPENIGQAAPVATQPPAEQAPAPPQQGPPIRTVTPAAKQAPVQIVSSAPAGPGWSDLADTMNHCLMLATGIWGLHAPQDVAGDVAGAIERMAVSLYIDARKMGLVAPVAHNISATEIAITDLRTDSREDARPLREAVTQVVAAVGDAHQQELSEGGGIDDDDIPF